MIGTGDLTFEPSAVKCPICGKYSHTAGESLNCRDIEYLKMSVKLSKQAEIIKLLKQSNDFYENTRPLDLGSNDIEVVGYGNFRHGLYARSIRFQVEQLENEKT